ncbi:MAG: peptide-methionine (S)-S-oxide reductase MsrA [Myxococcales bacterium]|nr:peptide-methionine (S)-S-oxide reductase MsrA [Myxococcales bacterium]
MGNGTPHLSASALVVALLLAACTGSAQDQNPKDNAPANTTKGPDRTERAILSGGCFWGMEEILREIPGVLSTEVGYAAPKGAPKDKAEADLVVFDPTKLSYATLLRDWYFRMHNPTTPDRQGNDIGRKYRSALFPLTKEQERVAKEEKARAQASERWKARVVTEITPPGPFEEAPAFHQDYLRKNPGGYTCHYLRE